ncbi:unnamed protein product [Effrenium voratum]|nr:unnamed protein product [Effrenium voratum]
MASHSPGSKMPESAMAEEGALGFFDSFWSAFGSQAEQRVKETRSGSLQLKLTPVRRSSFYWKNDKMIPRSDSEIADDVGHWHCFVHQRARNIFSQEQLDTLLAQLARNVSKAEDPIASGSQECVLWHGDITINEKRELQAAICIAHKDKTKTVGFANRLLTFIFADDDSYDVLKKLPATKDTVMGGRGHGDSIEFCRILRAAAYIPLAQCAGPANGSQRPNRSPPSHVMATRALPPIGRSGPRSAENRRRPSSEQGRSAKEKALPRSGSLPPVTQRERMALVSKKMEQMRRLAEDMAKEEAEEEFDPEDRRLAELLSAFQEASKRSGEGEFEEAVAAWTRVTELDEGFQAWQERGTALAQLSRFDEAESDFAEALQRARGEEELASIYFSRGSARGDAGNEADAITDFGESLKLEPHRLEAWLSRGTAHLSLNNLESASADAEAALKLQQDSGAAWGLLGAVRQRQGRLREAVDACHMALKLAPELPWVQNCLEACLAELQEREESQPASSMRTKTSHHHDALNKCNQP